MRTSKLPTREAVVVEWVSQNCASGRLFLAGASNRYLIEALYATNPDSLEGCDIDPKIVPTDGYDTLGPNFVAGDFREWWRRAGGEGTFAAVVALGWPAKMSPDDPRGLVASCKWLLKPGGYFLMDWPEEMGNPMILASALSHVGFKQIGGFDTATHPVYIWRKER